MPSWPEFLCDSREANLGLWALRDSLPCDYGPARVHFMHGDAALERKVSPPAGLGLTEFFARLDQFTVDPDLRAPANHRAHFGQIPFAPKSPGVYLRHAGQSSRVILLSIAELAELALAICIFHEHENPHIWGLHARLPMQHAKLQYPCRAATIGGARQRTQSSLVCWWGPVLPQLDARLRRQRCRPPPPIL